MSINKYFVILLVNVGPCLSVGGNIVQQFKILRHWLYKGFKMHTVCFGEKLQL